MKKPMVSIIIPVYNGSNYVCEAIDSALAQTYKNVEVIVVNDGSKDDGATERICLSYGNKIRYIQKENGGVSSALNMGIKNMKGEYFSWLSHDDTYEIDKIEKQIRCLNEYEDDICVLLCESKQIDSNSNEIKNALRKNRFPKCGIYSSEQVLENLFLHGAFNGCALLIRKDVFEQCGLFNEKLRYCQDALMWYKIHLQGYKLVYSDDICVCNRIHNKQLSRIGLDLFYKDSYEIANEIVPMIIKKTIAKNRLLYLFVRRQAIWHCKDAFNLGMQIAAEHNFFSLRQKLMLRAVMFYGKIRPAIRRTYYRITKGVVTQ